MGAYSLSGDGSIILLCAYGCLDEARSLANQSFGCGRFSGVVECVAFFRF